MIQVGGEAVDPVPDGGNPPESASADKADHIRQNGDGMAPGAILTLQGAFLESLQSARSYLAERAHGFSAVPVSRRLHPGVSLFDPVITV